MKDFYAAMQEALGYSSELLAAKLAERRFVPIDGKIDREKADGIRKVLTAMELKEVAPITLLISSEGGNVTAGNRIIDMIQALHSPVDGLIIDYAGSMAVDILLMCRKRSALPHAEIFIHYTRWGLEVVCDRDDISDEDIADFRKRATAARREREEFYMKRLRRTRKEVVGLLRMGEKYSRDFTAREALEIGFIDKIDTKFKIFDPPAQRD